jgi:hypothetical protein
MIIQVDCAGNLGLVHALFRELGRADAVNTSTKVQQLVAHLDTPDWPTTAAFLIGATIKVKLKASKYASTSQILFFSPNEERSTSVMTSLMLMARLPGREK